VKILGSHARLIDCKWSVFWFIFAGVYVWTIIERDMRLYGFWVVCVNECKSFIDFIFWCATVRMRERLQETILYYFFGSAIVRTYEWLQVDFKFLWRAVVHTYERLPVICDFLFISFGSVRRNNCKWFVIWFGGECNRSHIWTIASDLCFQLLFFRECNRLHVRTIASDLCFYFVGNAIVCTYEWLQVICVFIF